MQSAPRGLRQDIERHCTCSASACMHVCVSHGWGSVRRMWAGLPPSPRHCTLRAHNLSHMVWSHIVWSRMVVTPTSRMSPCVTPHRLLRGVQEEQRTLAQGRHTLAPTLVSLPCGH